MNSWQKVTMCPYLGLSTLILPPIYHFGPDLALFIWLYLPFIALIWPYMPYSPYMYRYSASQTAPLRKIERLYLT